jgi:hypothetical protein
MNTVEPSHETHLVYQDLFDNRIFFEKCVFLNVKLTNFSIYWKKNCQIFNGTKLKERKNPSPYICI